jgi:3-oxoadipate enol-lactonase
MDEGFAKGAVAVSIAGAGPPLWLFHSLLADRDSFAAVRGPLAERFTVHLPELPGFGMSTAVQGGLVAVADRMAEALRDRGRDAPIVLGNGYGGFVALQMAIRHPGLVRGLVLADCGACFSEAGRQAFRAMAAGVAAGGAAKIVDVAMRRLFAPDFQDTHPQLMAERRAAFLRTDPAVLMSACHALAELDLRAEVGKVQIPALVLVGERDEATPPAMSRELASLLPDARLVVLDGCAHVPQLQDPERFLAAFDTFATEMRDR